MLFGPKVPPLHPAPPTRPFFVCLEGIDGNAVYVDPHRVAFVALPDAGLWPDLSERGARCYVQGVGISQLVRGSAPEIAKRLSEARRGIFRDSDV
jgi:hypothetical protein